MKNLNFLAKAIISSIALITLAGLAAPIARADEVQGSEVRGDDGNPYNSVPLSQQTLNEFSRTNRSNYSIDGTDNGLNFTDIIHNHNLFGGTTPDQFRSKNSSSINNTVEDFRAQQRQKLVEAESSVD